MRGVVGVLGGFTLCVLGVGLDTECTLLVVVDERRPRGHDLNLTVDFNWPRLRNGDCGGVVGSGRTHEGKAVSGVVDVADTV